MAKLTVKIGKIEVIIPEEYFYIMATTNIGKFPMRAMKYLDKKLNKMTKGN